MRETGKPIAQVARDLRINAGTLSNWVNADKHRRGGDGALSEDERAELGQPEKLCRVRSSYEGHRVDAEPLSALRRWQALSLTSSPPRRVRP